MFRKRFGCFGLKNKRNPDPLLIDVLEYKLSAYKGYIVLFF